MAEGLLRHLYGTGFKGHSAGIKKTAVNPLAGEVMREIGIDISSQRSKTIDEFVGRQMDYVVTVCDQAREVCPLFSGTIANIHIDFEDPSTATGSRAQKLKVFRRVRDELRDFINAKFAS